MKLQIDTKMKTVQVIESVNLAELIKALKGLLGDEYEGYTLEITGRDYFIYPWIQPIYIPYVQPYVPYTQLYYDYSRWLTTVATSSNESGSNTYVYNIDIQSVSEPVSQPIENT